MKQARKDAVSGCSMILVSVEGHGFDSSLGMVESVAQGLSSAVYLSCVIRRLLHRNTGFTNAYPWIVIAHFPHYPSGQNRLSLPS